MEIIEVSDFNLKQTMECGQCFNFEKLEDAGNDSEYDCLYEYDITAFEKRLRIRQEGRKLIFLNADHKQVSNIWMHYFDLDRDYTKIKDGIISADPGLKSVIDKYYGIRILNQDFVETLISFIISQNKNIPHIKQIVRNISARYGDLIDKDIVDGQEREYYSFPDPERLKLIGEEGFREMKTGFRAPYLADAAKRLSSGQICEEQLRSMGFQEAKDTLMKIKGVGDKVANCVLLFGLGFRNAFPVDVWIKRVMESLYFHEDTDKKIIEKFAGDKFGEYGGYAQQYLFIYARENL